MKVLLGALWLKRVAHASVFVAIVVLVAGASGAEALFVKGTVTHHLFGNRSTGTTPGPSGRLCPCPPGTMPYAGPISPTVMTVMSAGADASALTTGVLTNGDPAVPVGGSFRLWASELSRVGTASFPPGFLPPSIVTIMTFADARNDRGAFASGGGPGSVTLAPLSGTSLLPSGTRTLTVLSRPASLFSAVVTKGPRQFGGTMRLLGGMATTISYTSPAFPSGIVSMPVTPHAQFPWPFGDFGSETGLRQLVHTVMSSITQKSWITGFGVPWTTGSVTAIARTGSGSSSTTVQGFDTLTAGGHRNIQMVTPVLLAYTATIGNATNSGFSALKLSFLPEPGGLAALGFGVAILGGLYRMRRRRE